MSSPAALCRICDPVYFQDEIKRDASVSGCDIAELEFLRPVDCSDVPCVVLSMLSNNCSKAAASGNPLPNYLTGLHCLAYGAFTQEFIQHRRADKGIQRFNSRSW